MPPTYPEFLAGLAPADAAELVALGSSIRLSRGDVLFDLGQPADSLYVIEQGQIALTLPLEIRGHGEDILIEDRSTGQAVGWSALIPPHRFTLKATAPLDSRVVAFPRAALLDHFANHPAVGYVVMRNVAAMTGQRLQVFQAMWLREMQRTVTLSGV
jgi:CRP/FNR family transcriptional regulator, cyclic AMP receptor protein